MKDGLGRTIDYMRISVTDRCNLRCRYCMPEDICLTKMDDLLTYEEIKAVAGAAAELGIVHYRITGGEPLVRRDVAVLVKMLKETPGVQSVSMTTNGILLKEQAKALKEAGLDGVNVSLDTTDGNQFRELTGKDGLSAVLSGIEEALQQGIYTKLNAVNRKELEPFSLLEFAGKAGMPLRFIEMMPLGYGKQFTGYSNRELFEKLEKHYGRAVLYTEGKWRGKGPAVYYHFPGLGQPVGFISAIHGKFCADCNRVRLSPEGYLKLCLCYEDGVSLREVIRNGGSGDSLKAAMAEAMIRKPGKHCFEIPEEVTETKLMSGIGG